MEGTDALRRIVRIHWFVIVGFLVLGLAVGYVVGHRGETSYSSSARVALGTTTPQTQDEAAAVASVARAIVTSSTRTRDAIALARVKRDANDVARNHVSVQSLGTSNVVELTVTDRNADAARRLASALGSELERTWLAIGHGQEPQVVDDLNARLDALNQKIGDLDSQINSTVAPANGTDPVRTLLARREDLARQATALESERDRLVSQDATDVRAQIIDSASVPTSPDTAGQAQALVLGGIAGLIFGLGIAALLEAMAPSVLGSRRVAGAAGTILLGRLRRLPGRGDAAPQDLHEAAVRLDLAAGAARVETVELVAAPPVDLTELAATLDDPQRGLGVEKLLQATNGSRNGRPANGERRRNGRTQRSPRPAIRVFDHAERDRHASAFVIVTPTHLRLAALHEVIDLPDLTGRPLLGLITYERAVRPTGHEFRPPVTDEPTLPAVSSDDLVEPNDTGLRTIGAEGRQ